MTDLFNEPARVERRMILASAPDWTAVQRKLDRPVGTGASREDRMIGKGCPQLLEAVIADVRRPRGEA